MLVKGLLTVCPQTPHTVPALTSVRDVEVVLHEDAAEVGGGGLRGGGRVGARGNRGRGGRLLLRLRDAPEGDFVRGLPLQRDGVAFEGA